MERRALIRRKTPIKRIFSADILLDGNGRQEHCLVHIHDLSEGGMRVHTEYNFPQGEVVPLRLHLNTPIELNVKRVWEKPLLGGMMVYGLQFENPTELLLSQIRSFLERYLPNNRRKSFRLERILVVEIQGQKEKQRFGVFTLDLSTSGMRINHEEPLPEGSELSLRILLEPNLAPIAVRAKVSWQKENAFGHYLIGLQFTVIDIETEERIINYIAHTTGSIKSNKDNPFQESQSDS